MAGRVAGIDVHKKLLMVVVIDADAPAAKPERRRFTTMPSELRRLSMWLFRNIRYAAGLRAICSPSCLALF
jgi:hypothetical protein